MGLSPNEILLGYKPMLQPSATPPSMNELVRKRVDMLFKKRGLAIEVINKVAKLRVAPPAQYKKGEQVWLKVTHLNL